MRPFPLTGCLLLALACLAGCTPAPAVDAPYTPGFVYVSLAPSPTLVLQDDPAVAAPRKRIPLDPPADCSFFALRLAPVGRWAAVEWECAFGPAVELFDTASGASHFALSDPTIDSRFLAWQPDGRALYLKIGTLSVPQTLLVQAASGRAVELPVSPFAYDLTVPPDGSRIYYALTRGIGFGSEAWLAGPQGENASQLAVDALNILALAQYSPDGSQIAFIKFPDDQTAVPSGELWVMDRDGFNARRLADADAGRGFAPLWSPDGRRIAFVGRQQTADPAALNLSIYNLADAALVTFPASLTSQPAWSPDGSRLTFSASPIDAGQGDTMDVWFYEISGGKAEKVVSGACCAGWIR